MRTTIGLRRDRLSHSDTGFDLAKARPDNMCLRPFDPTQRACSPGARDPVWVIHSIDVKRAAEPSLRHFTEVTYSALALAAASEREGLGDWFAVSAEGFVWPGTRDAIVLRHGARLSPATEAFIADPKAHMSALAPPLEAVRGIIDALRGDRASHEPESR